MTNFEGFGLSPALEKSLAYMNYDTPTPIQEAAIPLALEGRDILGSAQTGTGKTAAFAIPLVEMIMRSPRGSALVLTPTRELAKQVLTVIHQLLGPKSPIKTAFIIGGEPMGKQFEQLRARPRIIVGTPGRINDHLDRGSMMLNESSFLVLDETDRMLDMGFGVQLDKILPFLPQQRQTLMFSATLPKGITQLAGKYLNNPERVSMGQTNVIAQNIKQDIIRIDQDKKYEELLTQLHAREGSVIIFGKTKHGVDKMAVNLRRDGFTCEALHGDLRQSKRDKVMQNFRKKNFRILVATDIAARGLDVPHIEHVINYDLPQLAEDYIHRMGRTARAGAEGSAVCFVSPQDGRKWHAIEQLLYPDAKPSRSEGARKGGRGNNKDKSRWKTRSNGRPNRKDSQKSSFAGRRNDRNATENTQVEQNQGQTQSQFDRKQADRKHAERTFGNAKGKGGSNRFERKGENAQAPAGKRPPRKFGGGDSHASGDNRTDRKFGNTNKPAGNRPDRKFGRGKPAEGSRPPRKAEAANGGNKGRFRSNKAPGRAAA